MNGIRLHRAALLSHGVAVALGVGCGFLTLTGRLGPLPVTGTAEASPNKGANGAAWADRAVREYREARNAELIAWDPINLSVAELLRRNRQAADRQRAELDARMDAIGRAARHHARLPDPAGAISSALRRDESGDEALAVFQAWLDRDPDAALAHLRRNWRLLDEVEPLPFLLERKYGREWLVDRLEDKATPLRMKRMVAKGLGKSLAWSAGLAEAVACQQRITDSELNRLLMAYFVKLWPLDEPADVARLLAENCPKDCRDRLLYSWLPMGLLEPYAASYVGWGIPCQANFEWFRQVRDALDPESVPTKLLELTASPPMTDDEPSDLGSEIAERTTSGASPEKAVWSSLYYRVSNLLDQHPAWVDDHFAGRLSREELLERLSRQVPGAAAYPAELAQIAWVEAASRLEPRQLVALAAELPRQGCHAQAISEGLGENASAELRPRMKLERYRIFVGKDGIAASLSNEEKSHHLMLSRWTWEEWNETSPRAAAEWRKSLPPADPMSEAFELFEKPAATPDKSP